MQKRRALYLYIIRNRYYYWTNFASNFRDSRKKIICAEFSSVQLTFRLILEIALHRERVVIKKLPGTRPDLKTLQLKE